MVIVIKNVKKGKKKINKERRVVLEQLFCGLKNIPLPFLQEINVDFVKEWQQQINNNRQKQQQILF
uniref:Uncharacterized protein n=1 Tax=Meloidogyne incognita TaxID=6306 RepID=A0A914MF49_MELIC